MKFQFIGRHVGGPEAERCHLPLGDSVDFAKIVQAETLMAGRRLLDWHASPADTMDPDADRRLDQTFALMWRTAAESE